MAHNPKLEVYKFNLKHKNRTEKTFRDFFIETLYTKGNEESQNSIIFLDYFKKFINTVDTADFISDKVKMKAFTAYDTKPADDGAPTIMPHSEMEIIEGTIEGGRYGQKRGKSSIDNKIAKENVSNRDIILDRFYFLLYTPLDSDIGFLIIQGYTEDNISDVFTNFIRTFFSSPNLYNRARVERFVPNKIIEEFREKSYVKRFTYSSKFILNQLSSEPIGNESEEFTIKIEAIAKNNIPRSALPAWLSTIGHQVFGSDSKSKELHEFSKGKVYLKNSDSNKESPFDISSDLEIKPVIYLENRIEMDEDGIPDFEQLKKYCFELLDSIKPEIYLINSVREH